MLDQPTQVYFPADPPENMSVTDLPDEDRTSVERMYRLIFDLVEKLAPNLQVIITDHADLAAEWFQEAVVEKWRKDKALVPIEWIKLRNDIKEGGQSLSP